MSHLPDKATPPTVDIQRPLRVATWNLERQGTPDRLELIESQNPDLLLAQEVTATAYEAVVASGQFDWSAFSLDHRPRSVRGTRSERLGVAIVGRRPLRLRASGILPWLMRPEKFLHADVVVPGWQEAVSVASYHASPGDGKPECSLQVAHWLELQFGAAILGLDANSPDVDHPDHERSTFHWQYEPFTRCEPALIGPPADRRHRLEDSLRLWLSSRPEEHRSILAARPDGPLACTYDRAKSTSGFKPSRFDSVWVSPEFCVERVEHLWDAQVNRPFGGSDHAMVVVDLVHPPKRSRRPRQAVLDHVIEAGLLHDGAELTFDVDLLEDPVALALLRTWIQQQPERAVATFVNDRVRPLTWSGGAGSFTLRGLASHICSVAGASLPVGPPGPHWWRTSDGRNLVDVSDSV